MKLFKFLGISIIILGMILTLYLTTYTKPTDDVQLFRQVMGNYALDTRAENAVASIYLNYRIFDTIFEALMLLVSVIGVVHFSRHNDKSERSESKYAVMSHLEENISQKGFIYMIVPIVIFLGTYLILNGHISPGGGFQGGAALSAALICIYLVRPNKSINFYKYEMIEKCIFMLIAICAMSFAVSNLYFELPQFNVFYLTLMNILIGLKVFFGLSIIFFRFVHYEDQ